MTKLGVIVGLLLTLLSVATAAAALDIDRTVFVPEEGMAGVVNQKEPGVYLRYEEYLSLRAAAQQNPEPEPAPELPEGISPFNSVAAKVSVESGSCTVDVDLGLNRLNSKLALIPLPDLGLRLLSAEVDGLPAALLSNDTQTLLIHDGKPHRLVKLRGTPQVESSAGRGVCKLVIPDLPIRTVTITVAGAAALTTRPESKLTRSESAGATRFKVLEVQPGNLSLEWRESGTTTLSVLPPLVNANLKLNFLDTEVQLTAAIEYTCHAGGLREFDLTLPVGFDFISATHGATGLEATLSAERVRITFPENLPESGQVIVQGSKSYLPQPPINVVVEGFTVAPCLDLTTTVSYSSAVYEVYCSYPETWLPVPASNDWNRRIQSIGLGAPLTFWLYPADSFHKLTGVLVFDLNPNRLTLEATWQYQIGEHESGFLTLNLPSQVRILEVTGRKPEFNQVPDTLAFRVAAERLEIALAPDWSLNDQVEVVIKAEYELSPVRVMTEQNSLQLYGWVPSGQRWFDIDVVVVYDPLIKIQESNREGVQPAVPRFWQPGADESRPLLTYAAINDDWSVALTPGLAPTKITGATLTYATVAPGVVMVTSEIQLEIQGAGVDKLSVLLPAGVSESVLFKGSMLSEQMKVTAPSQEEKWELRFQDTISGFYDLTLTYLLPVTQEAQQIIELRLPIISEAATLNHLLGVEAHDDFELTATAHNMREINVGELPDGQYRPSKRVLSAFRSVGKNPSISLTISAHKLLGADQLVIKSLALRSILSTTGSEVSHAHLEVINRDQQYLELQLHKMYDLWSAVVNNEGVKPASKNSSILIPLPDEHGQPVTVDVIYVGEHESLEDLTSMLWRAPLFNAPILSDTWTFYYPYDRRLTVKLGERGRVFEGARPTRMRDSFILRRIKLALSLISKGGWKRSYYRAPMPGAAPMTRRRGRGDYSTMETQKSLDSGEELSDELAQLDALGYEASMAPAEAKMSAPEPALQQQAAADDAPESESEEYEASDVLDKLEATGRVAKDVMTGLSSRSRDSYPKKSKQKPEQVFYESAPKSNVAVVGSQIKGMSSLKLDIYPYGKSLATNGYYQNGGTIKLLLISSFGDQILKGFAFLAVLVGGMALTLRPRVTTSKYSVAVFVGLVFLFMLELGFITPYLNAAFLGLLAFQVYALIVVMARRRVRLNPRSGTAVILALVALGFGAASIEAGVTVYVPYNDEPGTLNPQRRVYLQGKDFATLWQLAHPSPTPTPQGMSAFGFRDVSLTGTVLQDTVAITGQIELELYTNDWVALTWPLAEWSNADLLAVDSSDLVKRTESQYEVLLRGLGIHRLTLTLHLPLTGTSGEGSCSLRTPNLPAAQMTLTVPTPNLTFILAKPDQSAASVSSDSNGSVIRFALPGGEVTVSWQRKRSVSTQATAYTAEVDTIYLFGSGKPQLLSQVRYQTESGAAAELTAIVPSNVEIAGLEGSSVGDWAIETGAVTKLRITLNPDYTREGIFTVIGVYQPEAQEFAAPELRVVGARRVDRFVRLAVVKGWELNVSAREGVTPTTLEVAPERLPPGASIYQSFSAAEGWKVTASLTPTPLKAELAIVTTAQLAGGTVSLSAKLMIKVFKGSLYVVDLNLPAAMELESVTGSVGFTSCQRPEQGALTLYFPQGIERTAELTIAMVQQAAMTKEMELTIQPPGIIQSNLTVSNSLQVDLSDAYEVVKETITNGKAVGCEGAVVAAAKPILCYILDGAGSVTYQLHEILGETEAMLSCLVKVYEEYAELLATVTYTITRGYRSSFALTVPDSLLEEPNIRGQGLRTVTRRSENGKQVLAVEVMEPVRGEFAVTISYRINAQDNGWIDASCPTPLQVKRVEGKIALLNKSLGELEVNAAELLKFLPAEQALGFPEPFSMNELVKAYTFIEPDWTLAVKTASLESVAILRATIDYVHITTVLSQSGFAKHQVEINMINKREQYLRVRLPEHAELLKVVVAGQPVRVSLRDAELYVPLIKTSPWETSFTIDIVYQSRFTDGWGWFGGQRLKGPDIIDVPVSRSLWTLYLPPERKPYWFRGPMLQTFASDVKAQIIMNYLQDQERIFTELNKLTYNQQQMAIYNLDTTNQKLDASLQELQGLVSREYYDGRQSVSETSTIQNEISRLQKENVDKRKQILTAQQQVQSQLDSGQTAQQQWGFQQPASPDQPTPPALKPVTEEESQLIATINLAPQGIPYYFTKIKGSPELAFFTLKQRTLTLAKACLAAAFLLLLALAVRLSAIKSRLYALAWWGVARKSLLVCFLLAAALCLSLVFFGPTGFIGLLALCTVIGIPVGILLGVIRWLRKGSKRRS